MASKSWDARISNYQTLLNIRNRLETGKHSADLTHNERCNINKHIKNYILKSKLLYIIMSIYNIISNNNIWFN